MLATPPPSLPISGSPRLIRGLQPQPQSGRRGGEKFQRRARHACRQARLAPPPLAWRRDAPFGFRRHLLLPPLLLLLLLQRPREGRLQCFLWKSRSIQLLLSIPPPPPRVFAGWGLKKGGRSRARWLLSLLPSASDRPLLPPDLLVAFCCSAVASQRGHPPTLRPPGAAFFRAGRSFSPTPPTRAPFASPEGREREKARGSPGSRSASPMGSLLSGVSFKEPTTVEDCDSTWETDSEPEPELQDPGGEEEGPPLEQAGGGSDGDDPAADRQRQQPQQPEEPLPAAGGRPEAAEKREGAAEEEEEEQVAAVEKEAEKEGGDGVAEEDETEGREQGETEAPGPEQVTRDPLQTSAGVVAGAEEEGGALELFLGRLLDGTVGAHLGSAVLSSKVEHRFPGNGRRLVEAKVTKATPSHFWLLFTFSPCFFPFAASLRSPFKYLHALVTWKLGVPTASPRVRERARRVGEVEENIGSAGFVCHLLPQLGHSKSGFGLVSFPVAPGAWLWKEELCGVGLGFVAFLLGRMNKPAWWRLLKRLCDDC